MLNIDELKRDYIANLKKEGLYKKEKRTIWQMLEEYKHTKSIKTAADIVETLPNYHILDHELYYKLLEDSKQLQALKEKSRKTIKRYNESCTPQELSDRNRKVAIARWNKVRASKVIKDIK